MRWGCPGAGAHAHTRTYVHARTHPRRRAGARDAPSRACICMHTRAYAPVGFVQDSCHDLDARFVPKASVPQGCVTLTHIERHIERHSLTASKNRASRGAGFPAD